MKHECLGYPAEWEGRGTLQIPWIGFSSPQQLADPLRYATRGENGANWRHPRGKSGYRGVTPVPGGRWQCQIALFKYGGRFKDAKECAKRYDLLAQLNWGRHADLNFERSFQLPSLPDLLETAVYFKDPGFNDPNGSWLIEVPGKAAETIVLVRPSRSIPTPTQKNSG